MYNKLTNSSSPPQVIDTATAELLGVPPSTLDFSKEFSDLDKKTIREKIMEKTF